MRTKEEIDREYCNECLLYGDAHYKIWALKRQVLIEEEQLKAHQEKMLALNAEANDLSKKDASDVQQPN